MSDKMDPPHVSSAYFYFVVALYVLMVALMATMTVLRYRGC